MKSRWRHKHMNEELKQLAEAIQKDTSLGMQTAGALPTGMAFRPSQKIEMKTLDETQLLTYLEGQGCKEAWDTYNVEWYDENPNNVAKAMAEVESVPTFDETDYNGSPDHMRLFGTSFLVSYAAMYGVNGRNILQTEQDRGYRLVRNKVDDCLLNGNATSNPLEFNSIIKGANTEDLDGAELTESDLDDMLIEIADNDGAPDVLVTDYFVAKQLKAIAAPYRRWNDKVDIGLGFKVVTYESVSGHELAIIIDKHVPTDTTNDEHSIVAIDSSTIEIKELAPPSIWDMPCDKFAVKKAIGTWVTAHNVNPLKSGIISGIGDGE